MCGFFHDVEEGEKFANYYRSQNRKILKIYDVVVKNKKPNAKTSAVTKHPITFNNLVFSNCPWGSPAKKAFVKFSNGYEVSVMIGGNKIYSNGIDTYEFDARYNGEPVPIDEIGGVWVIGYINAEEVERLMYIVQQLPKRA